jgi:hypothetical protein
MQQHFQVNGEQIDRARYGAFHDRRINATLAAMRRIGARRVIELGGHPWVMTAAMIESGEFEVMAAVSAEEVCHWPDDIPLTSRSYVLRTANGKESSFLNYSANLERRLFDIPVQADAVIACEIVEHLSRAPHVMMLNMNRWLPVGGKIIITTPNGAQFKNPLRIKPPLPGYRCHFYERHQYLHTMDTLCDLIEAGGFRITEADYWDVYDRTGPARLYGLAAKVPLASFKKRFRKTLFVVAEKTESLTEVKRLPRCCIGDPGWEYVAASARSGRTAPPEE